MKLSLVTATYNADGTLESCLSSVITQVGVEVEHILIDGASSDGTLSILEQYRYSLAHVVSEPDEGLYYAMNKGIRMATGDVVGILNADDFYADERVLADVMRVFQDPNVDACYGDLRYVDAANLKRTVRLWRAGEYYPEKFYRGWMPPHPTFFVRRSVYERYGLFNTELGSAADYELMLRFLLRYRVCTRYIPRVLVYMRTGGVSNASLRNRLRANKMDRKAWEVNNLRPRPWTLTMKPLRKIGQWIWR